MTFRFIALISVVDPRPLVQPSCAILRMPLVVAIFQPRQGLPVRWIQCSTASAQVSSSVINFQAGLWASTLSRFFRPTRATCNSAAEADITFQTLFAN